MKKNRADRSSCVWKQTKKDIFKLIMLMLLTVVFVIGSTFFCNYEAASVQNDESQDVEFKLVKMDTDDNYNDGYIYQKTIDSISELDYITAHYEVGTPNCNVIGVYAYPNDIRLTLATVDLPVITIENEEQFLEKNDIQIKYDAFNGELFSRGDKSLTMVSPVIVPKSLYEKCKIHSGDNAYAHYENESYSASYCYGYETHFVFYQKNGWQLESNCNIMGYYEGSINGETPAIMSTPRFLNTLKDNGNYSEMTYSQAQFTIDASMRSNLEIVQNEINNILNQDGAGTVKMAIEIMGNESENTERGFYGIVLMVAAVVFAVGTSILLVIKSDVKTIEISKSKLVLRITILTLIPCIIGLLIGIATVFLYVRFVNGIVWNILGQLWFIFVLYYMMTFLATLITTLIIANKAKKCKTNNIET